MDYLKTFGLSLEDVQLTIEQLRLEGQLDALLAIYNYSAIYESWQDVQEKDHKFLTVAYRSIVDQHAERLHCEIKKINTENSIDFLLYWLNLLNDGSFRKLLLQVRKENKIIAGILHDIVGFYSCEEADQPKESEKWRKSASDKVAKNLKLLVAIAARGDKYTQLTQIARTLDIIEIHKAIKDHDTKNRMPVIKELLHDDDDPAPGGPTNTD